MDAGGAVTKRAVKLALPPTSAFHPGEPLRIGFAMAELGDGNIEVGHTRGALFLFALECPGNCWPIFRIM